MKYRAVIFDMDGTVLNTAADLTAAVNAALRTFGYPERNEREVVSFLGNGSRRLLELSAPAGTAKETVDAMLTWYLPYYNTHSCVDTAPYAGIIPLMLKLRSEGIKTAIVSNKPNPTVCELDERFFNSCTDYRLGESPAMPRKPAPDMVWDCVKTLGLPLSECVYIGDTEVDIQTANAAGVDCIAVGWGFRSREQLITAGAGVIVDTPDALGKYLLQS